MIDLGEDLGLYQSRFLALKNHERETAEILEVRNFYGSNKVSVTILIDDEEDQEKEIEHCKDFVGQFGKWVGEPEVDTAFILDKDYNGIDNTLGWKELYLYD